MSGVYCYIQRGGAGATIRGLRLADRRQVREWTPGAASGPEAEAEMVLAAARWIAEQMSQASVGTSRRPKLILCLDLEGGRCAWLSPPSGEHEVVKAAVRHAAMGASDEAGAGPGLGVVWSSEYGEPGTDLSVQELADEPADQVNGSGGFLSRRKPVMVGHKKRLAVLAVPDVAARVLLDELDRLGVEVAEVTTLWHALAGAWDPSRAEALAGGVLERSGSHRAVASSEPATAVVALEPGGRLIWAWTREGKLIAAGSQRLRLLEVAKGTPRTASGNGVVETGITRRAGEAEMEAGARLLEVTRADAGRVVSDWLAWSAQLGVAPSRVVCIGPAEIVPTGLGELAGLAAVGQALGAGWPGSATTAVEEEDPVGATLLRLAGDDSQGTDAEESSQGRLVMVDLSSRPGRMSRRMHWWLASAGAAGAVALGVLAWQLDRGATQTRAAAAEETGVRSELFKRVTAAFPKLATEGDPVRSLNAGLAELRKGRDDVTAERPIADVLERVVATTGTIPNLKIKKISISSLTGVTFDFAVPDSAAGGKLLLALQEAGPLPDGTPVRWSGDTTSTTVTVAGSSEQLRLFKLRGMWQDRIKPASAAPAKGGS